MINTNYIIYISPQSLHESSFLKVRLYLHFTVRIREWVKFTGKGSARCKAEKGSEIKGNTLVTVKFLLG